MKLSPAPIIILRLAVAVFFLYLGYTKIHSGWLSNSEQLQRSLANLHQNAPPVSKWFIENAAEPGVELWSRLIALGEVALGISLLIGLLVRLSTSVGIVVVLIYHITNGAVFSLGFIGNPWGILVIVSLLVLNLTRAGRKWGFDAVFTRGK